MVNSLIELVRNDLSSFSSTFPLEVENEIDRDNVLGQIESTFNRNNTVIMIEGEHSSGKTTLLSQFALKHPSNAITFFIGDDYYSSNLRFILIDLCKQMSIICSDGLRKWMEKYNLDDAGSHELDAVFYKLYRDICKQARQKKENYYIVIDGLEKIKTTDSDFFRRFAIGDSSGVYVLLSTLKGIEYEELNYTPIQISYFSKTETKEYLKDYLTEEESYEVYYASDGMPGYLSEIYRQLRDGEEKVKVLTELPRDILNLIEKTWRRYSESDDEAFIELLSLLTYAPEALTKKSIINILGISEFQLETYTDEVKFIKENFHDDTLVLINSYKTFFSEKLHENKLNIYEKLISFYETNNIDSSGLIYLPELYNESKKYESLVKLIDSHNIFKVIQSTQQISLARKQLRILSNMSIANQAWNKLSWSMLTEAVFTQLATASPATENQIKAQLALGMEEEALQLAFSCVLPEDRLFLLSQVCMDMKKKNKSISSDILSSIDETIDLIDTTVEISDDLIDKLIDICSNIFPIDVNLSLKLIRRVANTTGEVIENDKLMDYLLIRLLLRVDKHDDNISKLHDQIDNNDIQNFMKVAVDLADEENYVDLINKIEVINDTSAKLFYLQNWCSRNKESSLAVDIVDYALEIMINSSEHTTTVRSLRMFAKPLEYSNSNLKVQKIISKIENLLSVIIKTPVDEYTRLQLSLAKCEKQWSKEKAEERLYTVYVSLDDVTDYDSKCLILIHLLNCIENHFPDEQNLYKDLKNQLTIEYNRLINTSADQFHLTKKILYRITKLNIDLALIFARKINTAERRNFAYAEILRSYVANKDVDFSLIDTILSSIDDKPLRDAVLIRTLEKLSKLEINASDEIKNKYYGKIKQICSNDGKSLAFSYYINWYSDNINKTNLAYEELKISLKNIVEYDRVKRLGYNIVKNLSVNSNEKASDLYKIIVEIRSNEDSRLTSLFNDMLELLIRMVPDILKGNDYKFHLKHIKTLINSINSPFERALKYTSLCLRFIASDNREIVNDLIDSYLDIVESSINDIDTYTRILIETAPLLYEYFNKDMFLEKINTLNSDEYRDVAIKKIIRFIITKRPIEDPVDMSSFRQKINFPEAIRVCQLINELSDDSSIYSMISILIDSLLDKGRNHKYVTKLREKQLLTITENLIEVINRKLPDAKNIKHNGYKLACLGQLLRLKDTGSVRASRRWEQILPSRNELKREAIEVPNISDKVFVLTRLGETSYFSDEVMGISFLKEAEKYLNELSNPLDRVTRYEMLAESYQKTSNEKSAKYLLEQAFILAKACSHEQGRDQMLGGLIELAHSIDPDLAQNYAASINTNESLLNFTEKLTTLNLHQDPKKIINYKKKQTQRILNELFNRDLRSLCSARGITHHDDVIGESLGHAIGLDFETVSLGISWYIENTIAKNKNRNESNLSDLFNDLLKILELINNIENSMSQIAPSIEEDNFYRVLSATNIHTFGLGDGNEAKQFIIDWINNNTSNYLRIYDPYINEEVLDLIKESGYYGRVFIFGRCKTSELDNILDKYKTYWRNICDQIPPDIHFQFMATNSGETPMHDRFIIGEKNGLNLGTSVNGFGNKYSSIKYLDLDEKNKIDMEIITPMMMMPPAEYKGEKVYIKLYSLNS